MVAPISQIEVFSNASVLPNRRISLGVFPVNNSAKRSATLRGENFVKITFNSGKSIPIPAFAFIEYDGQLFFTKEIYRPEPKGNSHYEYNVKFVSFDNLLSKPNAYRHVVVGSGAEQQTWNEPEIEIMGTLQTVAEVVCESIKASADRYEGVFADMLSKVEIVSSEVSINTESKAFSFSGHKLSQVLDSVANDYEIDYWFEQVGNMTNGISKMILHFRKYERTDIDPLVLSDKTTVNRLNPLDPASPPNPLKPTVSGGLDECTFANEWSGVVQRITPFGSERNITRQQAIVDEMFVSYGKRLRLEYDHSCTIDGTTYQHAYAVKDEDGNTIPLEVDENGSVYVPGITTGEETVEKYDDIYPRGHFRVTHVTQRGVDKPIYSVYAIPTEERNGQYVDLTDAEIDAMQADPDKRLFPIVIQEGQTLSIHFESGYLNGREFEVANKSAKMVWTGDGYKVDPDNVNAHWVACFEIEPQGDNSESPQVPFGNMVPRGNKDITGYEGDMFAIFNMDMPPFYKESAMNELAQRAYDEITSILSTRPEVKCRGNEEFFLNHDLCLGLRVKVTSDLFGEGTEFVSRVTNYSYQLSRPNNVDFRLCSSRVQGSISILKGAIADHTSDISGIQQTERSLSRRAFRDSQEMMGMLQAIVAEMMVVGVERNQFTFTMGIECLEAQSSPYSRKFSGLKITAGEIQHSQEPYIKDAWGGHYTVDAITLTADKNNNSIGTNATEEIRNTPYYLYAVIDGTTGKANMELWATKKEDETDEAYLLLGILSSEFVDGDTSLRVFNRSNGFTQIAGGTITTEQLQDPTRQLIIDMSSNPPRIIAKRGAQIIGNITFISSEGAETNLATKMNNVDEELAKEIGGENLYSGVDPLRITKESGSIGVPLEDGKKYVVSVQSVSGTATDGRVRIYEQTEDGEGIVTHTLIGTIEVADSGMSYTVVEGHGGELELRCSANMTGKYYDLSGIMVQQGEKPTTYQPTYKYLAESFEHDASKQVTDINGGLLATSLIKLRNLQGIVMAGISGLNDGIVLWGGGSYADALSDAAGTTDILPVLLTTDPYGIGTKLGIFKIKKDANHYHYLQVDDNGVPSIQLFKDRTASSVISELSPTTPFPAGSAQTTNTVKIIGKFYEKYQYQGRQWYYEHYVNGSLVEVTQSDWSRSTTETKVLLNENMTLEASSYKFLSKVNFGASLGAHQQSTPSSGTYSGTAESSVTVRLTITNVYTNEVVGTHTFIGEPDTSRPYSYDIDIDKVFAIQSRGTYNIKLDAVVEAKCTAPGSYNTPGTDIEVYGQAQGLVTFQEGSLTNLSSRTVLCKDGFVYLCGGYNFTLRQDINSLDVRMVGLPETRPSTAGRLYTQTMTINGSSQKVICIS